MQSLPRDRRGRQLRLVRVEHRERDVIAVASGVADAELTSRHREDRPLLQYGHPAGLRDAEAAGDGVCAVIRDDDVDLPNRRRLAEWRRRSRDVEKRIREGYGPVHVDAIGRRTVEIDEVAGHERADLRSRSEAFQLERTGVHDSGGGTGRVIDSRATTIGEEK